MNPDTFSRGWVAGLEPIAYGNAAFAIMNDTQLTAIPPALRRDLVFLPFPGSVQSESWLIGSVHFLAIPETSRKQRAANALRDYLSGEEVTTRLSGSTGRPFFSWAVYEGTPPEVLDAWISRANTPELHALARWAVD